MNQKGLSVSTKYRNIGKWGGEGKFTVTLKTANLNEVGFSEYYWNKGIYLEQVKEWWEAYMNINDNELEKNAKVGKEPCEK